MNTKVAIINKILDNPVYLPESGMRKNLVKSLTKLSLNDLQNLKLVIDLKQDEVSLNRNATELAKSLT